MIGCNGEDGTIGESIRIRCIKITECSGIFVNGCIGIAGTMDASSMELTDTVMVTSEDEFRSSVTDTWNESEPVFGLGSMSSFHRMDG